MFARSERPGTHHPDLVTLELGSARLGLSIEEELSLLDEIECSHPRHFLMLIPEALSERDLRLVAFASSIGLRVVVDTRNGLRLTSEDVTALKVSGVAGVMVPLHAAEARKHDLIAGRAGSHRDVDQLLPILIDSRVRPVVISRFLHDNVGSFDRVAELVRGIEPAEWWIEFDSLVESLPAEDFPALFEKIVAFASGNELPIVLLEAPHFRRTLAGVERATRKKVERKVELIDCRESLYIAPDGGVFPDRHCRIEAGNVLENELSAILSSAEPYASVRDHDRIEGVCSVCDMSRSCGGSRLRAYLRLGDPLASDPGCPAVAASLPRRETSPRPED